MGIPLPASCVLKLAFWCAVAAIGLELYSNGAKQLPRGRFSAAEIPFAHGAFLRALHKHVLRPSISGGSPEPTRRPEIEETVVGKRGAAYRQASGARRPGKYRRVGCQQSLARLMQVTDGEASKRWQEIENRLDVRREGMELRIALKA
jgi:hypothetical protein